MLVADNVNEYYGKFIVAVLNDQLSGPYSEDYYVLREDDYELYTWEP